MTARHHSDLLLKSLKTELSLLASALILSTFSAEAQQFGLFRVSRDSMSFAENGGTANILVRREGNVALPAAVDYRTRDINAKAGLDYTATAGTLNFPANVAEASFDVPLLDDGQVEGDENIEITLQHRDATGATRVADLAQLRILDNERPALVDETFLPPNDISGSFAIVDADRNVIVPTASGRELLRLNSDGAVQARWSPPINTNTTSASFTPLGIDSSGRVLIQRYETESTGLSRSDLLRLSPDGSLDRTWPTDLRLGSSGAILAALLEPDGKWVLGGNSTFSARFLTRSRLARVLPDGSLDESFVPQIQMNTGNPTVRTLARQPDGKLLVGGSFSFVNRKAQSGVVRLNPDGSTDTTFAADVQGEISSIALQEDGHILIGGIISSVNGVPLRLLARLNPDGLLDQNFRPSFNGFNNHAESTALLVQAEGIYFSAGFTRINGISRRGIVRFSFDGSVDETFDLGRGLEGPSGGFQDAGGGAPWIPTQPVNFDDASWIRPANLLAPFSVERQLLIKGTFQFVDGKPWPGLVRLTRLGFVRQGVRFASQSFVARENGGSAQLTLERLDRSDSVLTFDYTVTVARASSSPSLAPLRGSVTFAPLETTKALALPLADDGLVDGDETYTVELHKLNDPQNNSHVSIPGRATLLVVDNERPPSLVDQDFAGKLFHPQAIPSSIIASVEALAVQPDSKILLARSANAPLGSVPSFPPYSAIPDGRLIRLSPDGSLDASFQAQIRTNDQPQYLAIGKEGRIYVGGLLNNRTAVMRLLPNGAVDPEFATNRFATDSIRAIAVQPDGKLLVGLSRNPATVKRINQDGSPDTTFTSGIAMHENSANSSVNALQVLADGKLFAAGRFVRYGEAQRQGIVRLNADGSLDTTFDAGELRHSAGFASIDALAASPGGGVLIAGYFDNIQGVPRAGLARLNPDGSLDQAFDPSTGSIRQFGFRSPSETSLAPAQAVPDYIRSMLVDPNGRIWVGGGFTQLDLTFRPGLVRLLSDGRVDPEFASPFRPSDYEGFGSGFNQGPLFYVSQIVPHTHGAILAAGAFTEFDSTPAYAGLARILPAPTSTASFEFVQRSQRTSEPAGQAAVTVRRRGQTTQPASVDVALNGAPASAGAASTFTTATLNFAPNEAEKVATIPLVNNGLVEGDRTVRFELRNPSPGSVITGLNYTQLDIRDDDAPVSLDASFVPFEKGQPPVAIALQADGKTIAAYPNGLVRLNADGSKDSSFQVTSAPSYGSVNLLHVDSKGHPLIGGSFTNLNGTAQRGLARLKPDGSLDETFRTPNFTGITHLQQLTTQPDGKVLLCGTFSIRQAEVIRRNLARLNTDGSLDTSFDMGTLNSNNGEEVRKIAAQPDGKLLVAGLFSRIQGTARPNLARLNADGSLDSTFQPQLPRGEGVDALLLQSDGRIVISHRVNMFLSIRTRLERLLPDGAVDLTFTTGNGPEMENNFGINGIGESFRYAGFVNALASASDGGIWAGGIFTHWDGVFQPGIARLNSDGTLNNSFHLGDAYPNFSYSFFGGASLNTILSVDSDRILVAGSFNAINGEHRAGLARLFTSTTSKTLITLIGNRGFIPESESTATFTLRRSGDISRDLILNYTLQSDTATAGEDFTAATGIVRFRPLETEATIIFSVRNDTKVEPDEISRLILSTTTPTPGLSIPDSMALTILDDERNLSLDASFSTDIQNFDGTPGGISYLELLSDGKMLVSGNFYSVNGAERPALARLHSNGALDPTFNARLPGEAFNTYLPIAPLEDGRVVVVVGLNQIIRFNPDGSIDTSFHAPRFNTSGGYIQGIKALPDGKLLVFGGSFNVADTSRKHLVRLQANGALDESFGEGLQFRGLANASPNLIQSVAPQLDGKLLIGGAFSAVNGEPRTGLARLDETGALDPTFNPTVAPNFGSYSLLAVEPSNGRILFAGGFKTINSRPRAGLARLFPDGSLDESFDPGTGPDEGTGSIGSLAVQSDGKVVLAGYFNTFSGVPRRGMVRLLPNGEVDLTFDPGYGTTLPVLYRVAPDAGVPIEFFSPAMLKLQLDGQILVAGNFTHFNHQLAPGLIRVNNDFVLQILAVDFTPQGGFRLAITSRTGRSYALESSDDLQHWSTASTSVATGSTLILTDPEAAMFPHRFYRAVSR